MVSEWVWRNLQKKIHVRLSQALKETEESDARRDDGKGINEKEKRYECIVSVPVATRYHMYRFVITIICSCQAGNDVEYTGRVHLVRA